MLGVVIRGRLDDSREVAKSTEVVFVLFVGVESNILRPSSEELSICS